jgi:hypothetical protein
METDGTRLKTGVPSLLSGQETELFTGSDLPKGTRRISVSGKGIPAGQYILVVESDSGKASGKIIFH